MKDKKVKSINSSTKWGTYEWFTHLASNSADSAVGYFSHNLNGYQLFRHEELVNFISNETQDIKLNDVTDVGCGGGHFLDLLNSRFDFKNPKGIDFIEPVLNQARIDFPHIDFINSSLPNVPLEHNSQDMIILSEVLYYLDKENKKESLDSIYRSIKPGGYIFFTSTLGKNYFTDQTAIDLIESKFKIKKVKFLHSKLYSFINFLPYRIVRFSELLKKNELPGSELNQNIYNKYKPFFSNAFSMFFLKLISKLCLILIASKKLPKICEIIARLMGKKLRGNIIILGQKNI